LFRLCLSFLSSAARWCKALFNILNICSIPWLLAPCLSEILFNSLNKYSIM
jgi:hypothetical protein